MKRYLLDTNIVSDMMRDLRGPASLQAQARSRSEPGSQVGISVVVQCEIEYDLARKPNARLAQAYALILQTLDVLPLDRVVAAHYAQLRTTLEAKGTPIGPLDTLIAAHSLALDATLVSGDAEFTRVPGLTIENWLQPDPTTTAPIVQ